MTNAFSIRNTQHEDATVFEVRFLRCYRLLHLIACRVLGSPEQADDAIESCWFTASQNPPQFEYEGAFRSWLLRVLIDEALAIRRENQQTFQLKVSHQPTSAEVFEKGDMSDAESNLPTDHNDQQSQGCTSPREQRTMGPF